MASAMIVSSWVVEQCSNLAGILLGTIYTDSMFYISIVICLEKDINYFLDFGDIKVNGEMVVHLS